MKGIVNSFMRHVIKHRTIRFSVLCVIGITSLFVLTSCEDKKKNSAPPPPIVGTVKVSRSSLPIILELPANIFGSRDAEVRAQVSGIIKSRNFSEGSYVNEGDTLFTIDKEKYSNALNSANGMLRQAESEVRRSERDFQRISKLFKDGAISQKNYDDILSVYEKACANLETAKANLETAKINLDYTEVRAPISGLVRSEALSVGNLIPVSGLLTTIVQTSPIHVHFSLSGPLLKSISKGYDRETTKSLKAEDFSVTLMYEDGSTHDEPGKIIFIDSAEDQKSGCISIKAEFPNINRSVTPGQFARVKLVAPAYTDVLLIPSSAILTSQQGLAVYTLTSDNKAAIKPVSAKLIGNDAIIFSGVNEGEIIVTEGITKVMPGFPVTPLPSPAAGTTSSAPAQQTAEKASKS